MLLPFLQRAQARAAAEMRDDHAAAGDLRRDLAAAPTRCIRRTGRGSRSAARRASRMSRGQRHELGDGRLAAVEARVEAGHLRHVRQALGDGFDRREVVRLMQRRQRNQLAQVCRAPPASRRVGPAYARRRARRGGRRRGRARRRSAAQPRGSASSAARPSLDASHRARSSTSAAPCAVLGRQPRRRADAFDLSACLEPPGLAVGRR